MRSEDREQKLCFVAGPIGDANTPTRTHADWLLHGIIIPTFAEHFPDYRVERADQISTPGIIGAQVINRLLDAELVIVDMSLQNANAFYEMGIRHMKRLPTIHMCRQGEAIPFDVAPHRAILFNYAHPNDLQTARNALKAAVEEATKKDFEVENPVTHARGLEKIDEHATSAQKLILEELQQFRQRLCQNGDDSSNGLHPYGVTRSITVFDAAAAKSDADS